MVVQNVGWESGGTSNITGRGGFGEFSMKHTLKYTYVEALCIRVIIACSHTGGIKTFSADVPL